jgi:hypothetical protein
VGQAFELGGAPLGFGFQGVRLLRDAGLSPRKTRGFPGKGNREAEGTPRKAGRSAALQSQRRPLKKAAATSAMRAAGGAFRRVNQSAHGRIGGLLATKMGRDSSLAKGARRWGGGPLCAGRRFRRSESGRKSRPAPFGPVTPPGMPKMQMTVGAGCAAPRPHGLG